jgi:sensor histidine kinase YesM
MENGSLSILGQIIAILLGLFSTYIIFDFMSRFGRKLYYKKYIYVLAYIFYTFIIFSANTFGSSLLSLLITLIATAIIGHFLFNDKRIYTFYYSMFIVSLVVFQIVVSFLFRIICFYLNINFYSVDIYVITSSIIAQFANLSASRLFIICYKKKKIEKLTSVQYFNFLVLPIFSIFYITTLMMYVQTYSAMEDTILLLINIVSIIVLNIFITNIFQSISKNNELTSELQLYEAQAKIQYDYYTSLENKYKNSRKIIHDMKNHLQTIEYLYKLQENEKAQTYTEDMYKMFDKLVHKYYTSNKVLNIIINDKLQRAEGLDIRFNCQIGHVNLEFIKDIDQTTIFSNLLDNALEGVKDLTADKNITLKIDAFNDFIVINIANSIDKLPIKNEENFTSTKKNHKGFGLQNVKMALEKYEGNMRIDYDENSFKVNIVIPSN